jgi:uncharacterized membrane protein YfcA
MTPTYLFAVAVLAGAMNAIAGGGTFLVFPALIMSGVSPIVANATATAALWPGSAASAVAYRHDWPERTPGLVWFTLASLVGGLLGALALLFSSPHAFASAVPFLMLLATLLFTFGPKVTSRYRADPSALDGEDWLRDIAGKRLATGVGIQIAVGAYGGYFGAGKGILMLAGMSLLGMRNLHRMNAIRNVLSLLIDAVAVASFVVAGAIAFVQAAVMCAGAVVGGYAAAAMARNVDPGRVRWVVVVIAWLMTLGFFARQMLSVGD